MRAPSDCLSEKFLKQIWPAFSLSLKTNSSQNDYFSNICMICDFLKVDFINISCDDAQAYFDHLATNREKPLSKKTVLTKLSYLKSVYSFILSNKTTFHLSHLIDNPFCRVEVDEFDNYINSSNIPTLDEVDHILEACRDNQMLFLIITLVLKCSLTASEICSLRVKQIGQEAENRCFIKYENNLRTRYVGITNDVMELIMAYIKITGEREYLFYNKRNQVLQIRSLEMTFKNIQKNAGCKKLYTLRDLRNASIAYMLHAGADTKAVTEHAGITVRWLYRYNKVISELDFSPSKFSHIRIVI